MSTPFFILGLSFSSFEFSNNFPSVFHSNKSTTIISWWLNVYLFGHLKQKKEKKQSKKKNKTFNVLTDSAAVCACSVHRASWTALKLQFNFSQTDEKLFFSAVVDPTVCLSALLREMFVEMADVYFFLHKNCICIKVYTKYAVFIDACRSKVNIEIMLIAWKINVHRSSFSRSLSARYSDSIVVRLDIFHCIRSERFEHSVLSSVQRAPNP